MKFAQKCLVTILLCLSTLTQAQNIPQCDSLIIDCCTFDTPPNDTLILNVSNPTTVLFDYPGFILFDTLMDTVSKEEVFYFGLGSGFSPHTWPISAPLTLPFDGILELHVGFYDSMVCSLPIHIADTMTTQIIVCRAPNAFYVAPNPNPGVFEIHLSPLPENNAVDLIVTNANGQVVDRFNEVALPYQATWGHLSPGIYFVTVEEQGTALVTRKIVIEK